MKLIEEARVYKDALTAACVVNRKIVNTAIGRDVREALSSYPVHVLNASVTQRVVFAEAAARGQAVYEIDPEGSAAEEMQAVLAELVEYLK